MTEATETEVRTCCRCCPAGCGISPRLYGWVRDRALPGGRWRLVPPGMLDRLAGLVALLDDDPGGGGGGRGLRLVSRRQVNANNATRYVPVERWSERPVALVHPDDAAACGVGEGDPVEVRSASGRVTVTVRLDGGLRPGTVSVPHAGTTPTCAGSRAPPTSIR